MEIYLSSCLCAVAGHHNLFCDGIEKHKFMTEKIRTHVLVIGGGPGGYVAAIRAGQLASTQFSSKRTGSAAPVSSGAAFRRKP